MEMMWFYDEPPEEFKAFRKEALRLEKEHLEVRIALRDGEAALRADPGNPELQTRVEDLKKRLAELDRQAPWISSPADMPLELALWGVPHG